jgi:hypothetical protein
MKLGNIIVSTVFIGAGLSTVVLNTRAETIGRVSQPISIKRSSVWQSPQIPVSKVSTFYPTDWLIGCEVS